jgi:hypothetical protein
MILIYKYLALIFNQPSLAVVSCAAFKYIKKSFFSSLIICFGRKSRLAVRGAFMCGLIHVL